MTTKKKKKSDRREKYDFTLEWWLIEKKSYSELKKNPTAVIYTRVSDIKQVNDGNWLESQENACRTYAKGHEIKVLKVFRDEWISGAEMERDWLSETISYLKEMNSWGTKKVAYLLCTEISRLSRWNLSESEFIQNKIESTWVEIILTSSWMNITKTNSSQEMMSDMYRIRAKQERNNIRERSLIWSINKLKLWERIFTPPAWYERIYEKENWKTERRLMKKEPYASILKEWLELFANGVIESKADLTRFFNEKGLKSNFHWKKDKELPSTFVDKLLTIEKLYFYSGFIFYPNEPYEITTPVEAIHEPIINLSTMWKILDRIKFKWIKKSWWISEKSELFPLRWLILCPYCHFHMTWWGSRWKLWKIYHYYGCNRKDCEWKEYIPVNKMHEDYEKLLQQTTPKPEVLKLAEYIIREKVKDKNGTLNKIEQWYNNRINQINKDIKSIENKIEKLSKPELISKLEEEWSVLEEEKEILNKKITNWKLIEEDFDKMFEKLKIILLDPISVWRYWSLSLKKLQARVLYGDEIFYKKNEGFQTLTYSNGDVLFRSIFESFSSNGAGDGARTRNSLLGRQEL